MTKVGFNNLPVDAEGVTFESYLPETEKEAKNLRVCRAFAERFSQRKQEQQEKGNGRNATGLLLFGKYGTGKTLLAYAIMNELERQKLIERKALPEMQTFSDKCKRKVNGRSDYRTDCHVFCSRDPKRQGSPSSDKDRARLHARGDCRMGKPDQAGRRPRNAKRSYA